MTSFKKTVTILGLAAVLASPLGACSNTWHGMKSDYHHMTNTPNSDDKGYVPAKAVTTSSQTTTTTATPDGMAQSTTTTTHEKTVVVKPAYGYNN